MQEATTSGCESGRSTGLRKICRRLNSRRFEVGQIGSPSQIQTGTHMSAMKNRISGIGVSKLL